TGALKMTTHFVLPPGKQDVAEKLRLDGRFVVAQGRFTEVNVQKKINELSERSRGKVLEEDEQQNVVSNFSGRFRLANATLTFPTLTFTTPGTKVNLAGSYSLKSQLLDYRGTLFMDAKISETQRGFKRILL